MGKTYPARNVKARKRGSVSKSSDTKSAAQIAYMTGILKRMGITPLDILTPV